MTPSQSRLLAQNMGFPENYGSALFIFIYLFYFIFESLDQRATSKLSTKTHGQAGSASWLLVQFMCIASLIEIQVFTSAVYGLGRPSKKFKSVALVGKFGQSLHVTPWYLINDFFSMFISKQWCFAFCWFCSSESYFSLYYGLVSAVDSFHWKHWELVQQWRGKTWI